MDLRRGRCFACYTRWCDARPVGMGSACVLCQDRRGENLRRVELHGAWVSMCFNCAGRMIRLAPMPRTIDDIRQSLKRDRRDCERRIGLPDERPHRAERRGLERRAVGHAVDGDLMLLDDEIFVELVRPEDESVEAARTVARA